MSNRPLNFKHDVNPCGPIHIFTGYLILNCNVDHFRLYDSLPVRYGSDNKKFYQTVKSGCIEEVSEVFNLGLQQRGPTGPIQPKIGGHLEKEGPSNKKVIKQ